MLYVNNITVKEKASSKLLLNSISFNALEGEVVYIQGQNGSGKSTLLNTIMGNPEIELTSGEIIFNEKKLTGLSIEERSKLGVFLANQTPISIPGLSLREYLRIIYNIHNPVKLPVFRFRKILLEVAEQIDYPIELLGRNLNEGFSGGEKKKTEVLQLFLVKPKIILLDEVDSGLDKKSRDKIFTGLQKFKEDNPKTIWIIVSHYDEIEKYIKSQKIIMLDGGNQLV